MIVNGVVFPITGSPQTVTLTDLPADGLEVDVDLSFTDDLFCDATFGIVFAARGLLRSMCWRYNPYMGNFNDCQMPAG